jgi:TIR domain
MMPGEDSPPTDSATRRVPPDGAFAFHYKAFLSYNQRADHVLASALERGLEQFSKKWYRRRAFDVFRDATSLSANSALWPSLQANLNRTEYYILIASPESAASNWVPKELMHWLTHRGHRNLLFVLTDGEILWDETASDFDWTRTTSLNEQALKAKFDAEPLWVDCRWARSLDDAAIRRDARFPDVVASIASTLHGRSKSELFGEDLRNRARLWRQF